MARHLNPDGLLAFNPKVRDRIASVIRHGGPEQLRFLYCVATFDANHDGTIDDREWELYEKQGDLLISDSVAMCSNMGIVGALLLGLTHLITMGRPTAYVLSEQSSEVFETWLLWLAYSFNAASECGAFFTLCIAVITRNNLTNILPTRELKVDMLRSSNALGIMGVSLMITLWCFLLSAIFGTLVASPREGIVGCSCFVVVLATCCYFIAPIRYMAVLLLHEEVKRFMIDQSGSFLKQASAEALGSSGKTTSSFCQTVLAARHQRDRGTDERPDSVPNRTRIAAVETPVAPCSSSPSSVRIAPEHRISASSVLALAGAVESAEHRAA